MTIISIAFYMEGVFLWAFIGAVFIASLFEWSKMIKASCLSLSKKVTWSMAGFVYIFAGFYGLIFMLELDKLLVAGCLIIIFATDIGAFFIGKILKGPKLAPKISPSKTWSGAFGGILSAWVCVFFGIDYLPHNSKIVVIVFCFLPVIAIIGDLIESYAKRVMGVKDSSNMLPGHGGVLDRIDSILAVSIAMLFIMVLF
jgi:phosphatidate cytidylyltransferase